MKAIVQNYKKSIHDCGLFDAETIDIIWDFYVTHSAASASGLKRAATDYGLREIPYPTLLQIAGIGTSDQDMVMANKIDGILTQHDLIIEAKAKPEKHSTRSDGKNGDVTTEGIGGARVRKNLSDQGGDIIRNDNDHNDVEGSNRKEPKEIDIDKVRLACIQPYTIVDRNKPTGRQSKSVCLLTHMRNSFAHGNTYWFDNGNVLLEDKSAGSSGTTTSMILMKAETLVEWIKAIDIDATFYLKGVDRSQYESLMSPARKKDRSKKGK